MTMPTTYTASRAWATIDQRVPQSETIQSQAEIGSVSHQNESGWMVRIRQIVFQHSEVKDLFISIGDDRMVDYWIVIPHRDIAVVRELVKKQQDKVIALFAQTGHPPFQVDFHIIYQDGRDALTLVPSEAIRIPNF